MTPNQPELLPLSPCPWCSVEEAGDKKPSVVSLDEEQGYCVQCWHCWAQGPLFGTEAEAIAAWDTRQSQTVGVGFRMLEDKEIIQLGDEFLQDDAVTWVKAGDESGTRWMVGCKHSTVFFKPIRRRITPNDSGKEGGE